MYQHVIPGILKGGIWGVSLYTSSSTVLVPMKNIGKFYNFSGVFSVYSQKKGGPTLGTPHPTPPLNPLLDMIIIYMTSNVRQLIVYIIKELIDRSIFDFSPSFNRENSPNFGFSPQACIKPALYLLTFWKSLEGVLPLSNSKKREILQVFFAAIFFLLKILRYLLIQKTIFSCQTLFENW